MKPPLFFFFAIFFTPLKLFCQVDKGQWLIGGSAGFSYSQATVYGNNIKLSTLSLSPAVENFFMDQFAAGLLFNLGMQTYHSGNGGRNRISFVTIGPVARYYFLVPEKKINLFAEGSYGFSFSKYKFFSSTQGDFSIHYSAYSIKAGPAIFLNEHTALEITLGYNHSNRGPIDTATTTTMQIGVGLQIHFGKTHSR